MEVSDALLTYLIGTLDGFGFERLTQKLLAARDGEQFVALGGVHDGGADGFLRSILEERGKPTSFVQMGVEKDAAGKVRQTVSRLREVGRTVRTLSFWTPRKLNVDQLESKLSDELDLVVRVRDWDAVTRLVNANDGTRAVLTEHFRREIFELSSARQVAAEQAFDVVSDPSVYVFLQFERAERFGKGGLVAPIVDSLIYWGLRDTDPDSEKLLSRVAIRDKISALLPGAAATLIPSVDARRCPASC